MDDKIFGGMVVLGAAIGISYLVINDITGIGVVDDVAIMPLATLILDRVARLAY